MTPRIVAWGGGGQTDEQTAKLQRYLCDLTGAERPKICFVPTAVGDSNERVVDFYESWHSYAELSHLKFFPWPPPDMRELALSQNIIVVSGGNTANMLAIWRLHGFDAILRQAWESDVLLTGRSAGMICWFDACVTDSFGPQLGGMRDGLGFLAGSACPHYDGEELRRPMYRRLVDEGLPPGLAADDGVGLHYEETELVDVVTVRPGAQAYRVEPGSETPLPARLL